MEGENFTRASDSEQQLCAFTMPFSALWQKEEILKAFGLANLGVGKFLLGFMLIAGRNGMYQLQPGKHALVLHAELETTH